MLADLTALRDRQALPSRRGQGHGPVGWRVAVGTLTTLALLAGGALLWRTF